MSAPRRSPVVKVVRNPEAEHLRAPALPPPESPRLMTKAGRALAALRRWHASGRAITPAAERQRRRSACDACEYFAAAGNLGLGECQAPGCGCTRAKIWLASEDCPHPEGSRWKNNPGE